MFWPCNSNDETKNLNNSTMNHHAKSRRIHCMSQDFGTTILNYILMLWRVVWKNISKNATKSCKGEKSWAHGPTSYSHSSFQPLGRQGIWASGCTTHQRSCCSQGKPPCRLKYVVKTQVAFYLDAINTLFVFNPIVTICVFSIKYYYHGYIFNFYRCNPGVTRAALGCGSLGHVPNPRERCKLVGMRGSPPLFIASKQIWQYFFKN